MITFVFSNEIDAKIKIKRVVNIILAISLIELLLYKSCDGNASINNNTILLLTFIFSIILIEERKKLFSLTFKKSF